MQKVPGVTGVRISLNAGLTVLDFKADNTVTLAGLRQIIRNNGFVTREAQVVAQGIVTMEGNQLAFDVKGSRERVTLLPSAKAPAPYEELRERLKPQPSLTVVLAGIANVNDPKALTLAVTGLIP